MAGISKHWCSLSASLAILRVGVGGLLLWWGLEKVLNRHDYALSFPDPLSVGSTTSLAIVASVQVIGAAMLLIGMFTRLSSAILAVMMLVAAVVVHSLNDTVALRHALAYVVALSALVVSGPGKYSLDELFRTTRRDR